MQESGQKVECMHQQTQSWTEMNSMQYATKF